MALYADNIVTWTLEVLNLIPIKIFSDSLGIKMEYIGFVTINFLT